MTDTALELTIMETLGGSSIVRADEIAVQVDDGEAVLRGTVGSPVQRLEAIRLAADVPGVSHVADELQVRLLGIDGRADADTEAAVIDALNADDQVHTGDVDVAVDDGAGDAQAGPSSSSSSATAPERIALAVPGVASVRNELRVWLAVDAAGVAERVTDAIGVGAIVGADEVTVTVVDNDVTLTGTVTSAAHHDARSCRRRRRAGRRARPRRSAPSRRFRTDLADARVPRPPSAFPASRATPREPYETSGRHTRPVGGRRRRRPLRRGGRVGPPRRAPRGRRACSPAAWALTGARCWCRR